MSIALSPTLLLEQLWLTPVVHNYEIFSPQKIDREHTSGRGVFIALSNEYICTHEPELEADCKIIWIKLNVVESKILHICAYYNPNESDEASLASFDMSIRRICNGTVSHIWIAGDMNIPGLDLRKNCLKPSLQYPELTRKFFNSVGDNNLIQLITEPSWGPNTLDLFITNNETLFLLDSDYTWT